MPLYNPATRVSLGLAVTDSPTFAGINCPEIYNSAGDIKIMPDVQGNVNLFGDTDVDNGADGKIFTVNRRAAEGDTTISIFGNDDQWAHISANWDISIYSTVAAGVIEIGAVSTNIVRLVGDNYNSIGSPNGTDNCLLRHYGYITAGGLSGQRYVQWQVDDTDDYFWLTGQTASILGFKIDLPVNLIDNDLTTTGSLKGGAFGCNGATVQTAYASGGALASYVTGAFGLNSDANMSALHAMVVSIRAALVANGIMS